LLGRDPTLGPPLLPRGRLERPPKLISRVRGPCLPPGPSVLLSAGGEFFLYLLDETTGLLYAVGMTETATTLIEEIESFLALTASRNMFTAMEIQDLLLDLRLLAEPELN